MPSRISHNSATLLSVALTRMFSTQIIPFSYRSMGEEILAFLDSLMGRLFAALQTSKRILQETCMSAIGSVASVAEQAFLPYAERVLELMKSFMVLTNDEDLRSRARATELVGIVAMGVGRARMEPILLRFIEAAITGIRPGIQ